MAEQVKDSNGEGLGVEIFNPLAHAKPEMDIDINKFKASILSDEDSSDDSTDDEDTKGGEDNNSTDDNTDDQEDDTQDETSHEDNTDDAGDDNEDTPTKSERYPDEYYTLKGEVKSANSRIQEIIEEVEIEKPVKPDNDDDDEAQEEYKRDLREYEKKARIAGSKIKKLNERNMENAKLLQDIFVQAHPKENLKGFETYMLKNKYLMAGFLSGEADLETVYTLYKQQEGHSTKLKSIRKVSKMVKDETLGFTSSGPTKTKAKGNGMPTKYKYANMPMFSDYVKGLKKDMSRMKHLPDGRPMTLDTIESLCKEAYMFDVPSSQK